MEVCSRPGTPNAGIMGQSPQSFASSPPPTPGNTGQSPQSNVSSPPASPGIMDQGQFNMSPPSSVGSSAPGTPNSTHSSKNRFPNRYNRSPDHITLEEARAQMAAAYAKGLAIGRARANANVQGAATPSPSPSTPAPTTPASPTPPRNLYDTPNLNAALAAVPSPPSNVPGQGGTPSPAPPGAPISPSERDFSDEQLNAAGLRRGPDGKLSKIDSPAPLPLLQEFLANRANANTQVANIPPGVPVVFDRTSPVACPQNIVSSPQSIPVVYDTNSTVVCPMNAVPVRVKQNPQTPGGTTMNNTNMMCSCTPVSGGNQAGGGIMNTSPVSLASSGSPGGIMGMTPPAGYASPYFSPSLLPGVQTPVAHWLYGNNLMGHDTPPSLSPFGQVRSPGFANPLDPYAGNLMNLMQSPLQPQQVQAQQQARPQGQCVVCNPNLTRSNRNAG